jgi:CBS domain-containing protein
MKAGFDPQWRATVEDFMTTNVVTVDHDASIMDMAQRFIRDRYRRYPVMEDNRLVGQISRLDVLRALELLKHNAPKEQGNSNF